MYDIIINGTHAGYAENLAFIKMNRRNGSYNLCDEAEATGIVYDGKRYNLTDTNEVDGEGTATVVHVDIADVLEAQRVELEQTITDLQLDNIELQQRVTALEG